MNFIRKNYSYILAGLVVFGVIAVLVIGLTNVIRDSNANIAAGKQVIVKPEKIYTIAPPPPVPSAEVIAQRLHCTRFRNLAVGGGVKGIVLDEGSCYIGNVKYAIDTFQNPVTRDTWLRMARPMGVVPAFETRTSVAYKSVTS